MTGGTRRLTLEAALGLSLTLGGCVLWWFLTDIPFIRASGAPAWILGAAGTVLSVRVLRCGVSGAARFLALGQMATASVFVAFFFFLSALPPTESFDALETAPLFQLPDQDRRVHSLEEELGRGPVLLVSFRGPW